MPMYEYECSACGHRFEQIRKFSDPPVDVCPNCGEATVQKLLSSPAIQFKGTGWYITDYAKKGAAGTDTKESASTDASKPKDKDTKKSSSDSGSDSGSATPSTSTPTTAKASGE
jgi:putative FmdB family regulatory protein